MTRQYVGARYVPKFFVDENGSSDWRDNIPYEALTIVMHLGNSYTSKKPVPVGVQISNTEYWALSGNYNGQVEQYRQTVEQYQQTVDQYVQDVENLDNKVNNLNIYNVKDYGAIGDGTTDDTIAVKKAVEAVNTTGGVLYFPVGNYSITETIKITHLGTTIAGEAPQSTYIFMKANTSCIIFGNGETTLISCRVQNIGIIYNGETTPEASTTGLWFNNVVNSTINNVIIGSFYVGCKLLHAGNTEVQAVGIVSEVNNAIGFYVGEKSVSTVIVDCYVGFDGNAISSGIGLYSADGDIADLTLRYFDVGNGGYGVRIDGTNSPSDFPPADIRLYDIVCDGQRSACIYISNINERGNVLIDGGWLNPQTLTDNAKCFKLELCNNITITNMTLQQVANINPDIYGFTCTNCNGLFINNCKFLNLFGVLSVASINKIIFSNNYIALYDAKTSENVALNIANSSNVIINSNEIFGQYIVGISLNGGDKSIVTNNIINGSTTAITNNHTEKVVSNNL